MQILWTLGKPRIEETATMLEPDFLTVLIRLADEYRKWSLESDEGKNDDFIACMEKASALPETVVYLIQPNCLFWPQLTFLTIEKHYVSRCFIFSLSSIG